MKNKTNIMLLLFISLTLAIAVPYSLKYDKELALTKIQLPNKEVEINQDTGNKKKEPIWYESSNIIIIGDSRMYAADKVVKDKSITFIAKNGATCNYLTDVAEKEVDKLMEEHPDEHYTIFFNLGINDLDYKEQGKKVDGIEICSASDYVKLYKRLKEKWQEHNLIFESVNPLDLEVLKVEKFGDRPMSDNDKVEEFNDFIREEVSKDNIYYCDTYTYLLNNGFESHDGLHYSDETSKAIIQQLKEYYQKQQDKLHTI